MKILLIEDERMLADSLQDFLTSKGFQVEAVYDGEQGYEYAVLGIYDLLILDVMMPRMDGLEVARQVARHGGSTYYVGGFVRDALIHRENKDVDIEVHGITPQTVYISGRKYHVF